MTASKPLFLDDPYLDHASATLTAVRDNAVCLDRTVFYPEGGGQPGDSGRLVGADGSAWTVVDSVRDESGSGAIWHVGETPPPFAVGDTVVARLDWSRRLAHMRMHTCLHLLCSLIPAPVTGCGISQERGRLDFDLPENTLDKAQLTEQLNALIALDRPVHNEHIEWALLQASPQLVRTVGVMPPQGDGRVRLVHVDGVDRQPCGGTHVRATGEIGPVVVAKVEKKSRLCRRVVIQFAA